MNTSGMGYWFSNSPYVLPDVNPIGFQSQLSWELSSWCKSPGWRPLHEVWTLFLRGNFCDGIILLPMGLHTKCEGSDKTASLPHPPVSKWPFPCTFSYRQSHLLIFRSFSNICSTWSYSFGVSVEGGELKVILFQILHIQNFYVNIASISHFPFLFHSQMFRS